MLKTFKKVQRNESKMKRTNSNTLSFILELTVNPKRMQCKQFLVLALKDQCFISFSSRLNWIAEKDDNLADRFHVKKQQENSPSSEHLQHSPTASNNTSKQSKERAIMPFMKLKKKRGVKWTRSGSPSSITKPMQRIYF